MRRFTRLTNAFNKKVENHAEIARYFMWYNFGRVHQTLLEGNHGLHLRFQQSTPLQLAVTALD